MRNVEADKKVVRSTARFFAKKYAAAHLADDFVQIGWQVWLANKDSQLSGDDWHRWLSKCIHNRLVDYVRRPTNAETPLGDCVVNALTADQKNQEELLLLAQMIRRVHVALDGLRAKFPLGVECLLSDRRPSEVAQEHNASPTYVKQQVYCVRQALRELEKKT